MTSTFKLRTCDLLLKLLPIRQLPAINLELLDIVPEVRHMFGRESFIFEDRPPKR